MGYEEMNQEFIDIVAANFTNREYEKLANEARSFFFEVILRQDGINGLVFSTIWKRTWTLTEEVALTGEAIAALG